MGRSVGGVEVGQGLLGTRGVCVSVWVCGCVARWLGGWVGQWVE